MASLRVEELRAAAVLPTVTATAELPPTAWLVPDAAEGDDDLLRTRWHLLNLARDRLRAALLVSGERRHVLVFLVTVPRMPLIAAEAPDLLSVAEVMTIDEEPFAATAADVLVVATYRALVAELERRYGLRTEELQDRLFDRQPLPDSLSQTDLNRWKAAAEVLRKL